MARLSMCGSTIRLPFSVLPLILLTGCHPTHPLQPVRNHVYSSHPLAMWPWPEETKETLTSGVERWSARGSDGTSVELIRFDFVANPGLRFGLYDQDEDDAHPFD